MNAYVNYSRKSYDVSRQKRSSEKVLDKKCSSKKKVPLSNIN